MDGGCLDGPSWSGTPVRSLRRSAAVLSGAGLETSPNCWRQGGMRKLRAQAWTRSVLIRIRHLHDYQRPCLSCVQGRATRSQQAVTSGTWRANRPPRDSSKALTPRPPPSARARGLGPDTLVHLRSASFLATYRTLDKPYRCRSGVLLARWSPLGRPRRQKREATVMP